MSAMRFGRFGREDNTLVLVSSTGTLHMKILKRTAHFDNLEMASGPLMGNILHSYIYIVYMKN